MPALNTNIQGGRFFFSWSCSGTLAFRHNLNIPAGPGGVYMAQVAPVVGDAKVTAMGANTFSIATTATTGTAEFIPMVTVGDFA